MSTFRENFKDQIGFFNTEKQVIVYSVESNSCQYVASMLQSFGLRKRDSVKTFSTFLRKKNLLEARDSKKLMNGLCR